MVFPGHIGILILNSIGGFLCERKRDLAFDYFVPGVGKPLLGSVSHPVLAAVMTAGLLQEGCVETAGGPLLSPIFPLLGGDICNFVLRTVIIDSHVNHAQRESYERT